MKVIDLLNKIANKENLPKKIYYINREFYLKENTYFGDTLTLMHYIQEEDLNEEIEVLEEEKKIPEKLENEKKFYAYTRYEENKDEIDKVVYILKAINLAEEKIDNLNNSINSVIDYLKSKGNE